MGSRLFDVLKIVVTVGIIVFLYSRVGLENVAAELSNFNLVMVLPLGALIVGLVLVKFYRFQFLLKRSGAKAGYWEVARMYMIGFFLAIVTPSKVGDLSKFYYVHKLYKKSVPRSISVTVLDRFLDIITVTIISVAGAVVIFADVVQGLYILIPSIAIAVFVAWAFLSRTFIYRFFSFFLPIISKMTKKLKMKKIKKEEFLREFYNPIGQIKKPSNFVPMILITILVWAMSAATIIVIAEGFQETVPFNKAFFFVALSAIVSLLPITVSGIGTRDAMFLLLLATIGITSEVGLSIALIFFLFNQVIPAVVGGIVYILWKT